jgi:hypothetical protein
MKILVVKQLNGTLKPAYNSDHDAFKKLKPDETYQAEITLPRNIKFHRKFFSLIKMIYANQEIYKNMDRLRKDLLKSAGYYDEWADFHGEIHREAKSISFASMDQEEFDQMYNRILDEIVFNFNFDREEIIQNVEQYF